MKGVSIWRMPRTEQVYTFKHQPSGILYHFAVDQMNTYVRALNLQPEDILLHRDLVAHLIERGGWEPDHLEQLSDEAMHVPGLMLDFEDGSHVLADGVHRVLKHLLQGQETFPAYLVPKRIWERFLIVDFPSWAVDWDDFLANGARHAGLTPKQRRKINY